MANSQILNLLLLNSQSDMLVPKAENEMPICTNIVCVRQGKCGVLQFSDQHMTDVWMCPKCYCTIALPQQQTSAVVGEGDPVNEKPQQKKKTTAAVKTTRKKSMSPVPGPSKTIVNRSGGKKPAVQRGKKRIQPTPKNKSITSVKTNCGSAGRVHECKECGRCYGKAHMLQSHKKYKHTVSPHQCNTCDKCFTTAYSLKQHIATMHNRSDPFKCPTCGNCFRYKSNLNKHIKSVHESPKFECEACGKKFGLRSSLMQHALVHGGEKSYICEICGRGFTQPGNLAAHRHRHSN